MRFGVHAGRGLVWLGLAVTRRCDEPPHIDIVCWRYALLNDGSWRADLRCASVLFVVGSSRFAMQADIFC